LKTEGILFKKERKGEKGRRKRKNCAGVGEKGMKRILLDKFTDELAAMNIPPPSTTAVLLTITQFVIFTSDVVLM
jgi:hypothetical protein